MGELLEKYLDQKQESAPREKKDLDVAPSSVPKPILMSDDSDPTAATRTRGTKRTRQVLHVRFSHAFESNKP